MDLGVVFLTGLTVGGISCMAVQGGLLASTIAAREESDLTEGKHRKHGIWPTLAFLMTKFGAYLILGFILGAFGEALQLSDQMRVAIQFLAGLYMIVVALNLWEVHPIFRYAIIQPPRFLVKRIRSQSKSADCFAPAILGVMTVFIPCGTTLAMETLAISSGSPLLGASIMGAFILGTSPLFFLLGYLTTALGDAFKAKFLKLAGVLVIYLGLSSVNGALTLAGSTVNLASLIPIEVNFGEGEEDSSAVTVQMTEGKQIARIEILGNGYNPNFLKVKAGIPVRLDLVNSDGYSCASAFVIPALGIRKSVFPGESKSVEFTPQKAGKIAFSCSMGMYGGVIEVIP